MSGGTCKEVLYAPKATDLAYSQRYGFVGMMSELSAIDYPYFNIRATGVQIDLDINRYNRSCVLL